MDRMEKISNQIRKNLGLISVTEPKEEAVASPGSNESSQNEDPVVLNSFADYMVECEKLKEEKRAYQDKYKLMKREYEDKLNQCHEKEVQLKRVVEVLKHEIEQQDKLSKEHELQKEKDVKILENKLYESLNSEKNLREIVAILENRVAQDKVIYMGPKSNSCERKFRHNAITGGWSISKSEKSYSADNASTNESNLSRDQGNISSTPPPPPPLQEESFVNLYLHFY